MTPLFDLTFIDNQAAKTLVVLHGTGGNKSDFLFLDTILQSSFNLLTLQGNVHENGQPRFFKRLAVGVFDQASIKEEAAKLHEFMINWQETHQQTAQEYVYFGYSNGANMILALLFYYPNLVESAVLLHPMLPFTPGAISLKGKRFFISHGQHDPMVSKQQQDDVDTLLEEKGAVVIRKKYTNGHQISRQELQDAVGFLG